MKLQTLGAAVGSAPASKINLNPLRFTNVGEDVATISFSGSADLQYRISEDEDFQHWDKNSITIPIGGIFEVIGENSMLNSSLGKFAFSSGILSAEGNIMTLLYGKNTTKENSLIIPFNNAFSHLFQYCHLTSAPELPATTLTNSCYSSMFADCTYLTTVPKLPATTLSEYCYQYMFSKCTRLAIAPELPATTLANGCYSNMFEYCRFATPPELPATTLANSCYNSMFAHCIYLTTAPKLPATTLANSCYSLMFSNCEYLTTAPELPATTLIKNCYYNMFWHCSSLSYLKCLAMDISAEGSTGSWLVNVMTSGTFVKAAGMTGWSTGYSGIPSGWTVEEATE